MAFKLSNIDIKLNLHNFSDDHPLSEFDHDEIPDSDARGMALHKIDTGEAGLTECKQYLDQGLITKREYHHFSGDDPYNDLFELLDHDYDDSDY